MQQEQWIRDLDDLAVRVHDAREQIRAAFGAATDAEREANAQGRIHPDQERRVATFRRHAIGMAWFLLGVPAAVVAGLALTAARSWPTERLASLLVGVLGCGVLLATAAVWSARIPRARVETIRGVVTSDGPRAGAPTLLGRTQIPVPEHWIGQPVVAHLIRAGAAGPLFLSGDLDLQRVQQVDPSAAIPDEHAASDTASPTGSASAVGATMGSTSFTPRNRAPAHLLGAAVGALIFALPFLMEASGLVTFFVCLSAGAYVALALVEARASWRGSRTAYRIESDDFGQVCMTLTPPSGEVTSYPLGELTAIEHAGRVERRKTTWTFCLDTRRVSLVGEAGRALSKAVRSHRPDIHTIRTYYDSGAGGS